MRINKKRITIIALVIIVVGDIGFESFSQKGEEENYWYDYPINEKYCVIKEGGSEYADMIIEFWGESESC